MKELNDLTDLEICKEIARIEGVNAKSRYKGRAGEYLYVDHVDEEFNPLTDKALCFDLMVKYGVSFERCLKTLTYKAGHYSTRLFRSFIEADCASKSICLAIIAQHRLKGDTE